MHIWLEKYDRDTVVIGNYIPPKNGRRSTYNAWTACHIDGIHEMLGGDAYEAVKDSNGEPIEISLVVLKVDGEDVSGCQTASFHATTARQAAADLRVPAEDDLIELSQWFQDIGV